MKGSPGKTQTQSAEAAVRLAACFQRNGCLRQPNTKRRQAEGEAYHKGYEIRLIARNKHELAHIKRWLALTGFKPGKPYSKSRQWVLPVYGKAAMARFCEILEQHRSVA